MTHTQAETKMREIMRRKHLAYKTEQSYVGWLRRYSAWLRREKPTGTPAEKMEGYLTILAKNNCSPTTQNQAFHAIRFFYTQVLNTDLGNVNALRAKPRQHIRHAPTEAQTAALLAAVKDRNGHPIRLLTHILYGCGLRVSEPLKLRVKDIDLENLRLIIRDAKGGKDRAIAIPPCLSEPIRTQLQRARATWETDQAARIPVQLPGNLHRKYPAAQYSWGWAFAFPGHQPITHPRTQQTVRYHLHEANIQRAVRDAAATLDLQGVITPHILRHAYATHTMRAGAYVRDVQTTMGHANLETTMGYLHAETGRVPSPLTLIHSAA